MSNFDSLLERNRDFAASGRHTTATVMPREGVFVVTCLDPRVDPAGFLGLDLGDGMVIRNAGGRVTPEVLLDLAFITALAELQVPEGPLFEVAVVHHTKCGTGFLADKGFCRAFADRTGVDERALADQAVLDPEQTVRTDVERVRRARGLSSRLMVSGHVYDLDSGLVHIVVDATPLDDTAASGALA